MSKHICLFGGPGCGKSTAAAGLFSRMKIEGYDVEMVTEFAKDLVYSKDFMTLSDQIMVLAKQHHHWFKLNDQVEYTVSDAPFLLSAIYSQEKERFPKGSFDLFVVEMFKAYDTINIFIERPEDFQENGRKHDIEESLVLDKRIKGLLNDNGIEFHTVTAHPEIVSEIYDIIK